MESQPQNPEFRNNSENFHPCRYTGWSVPLLLANPRRQAFLCQSLKAEMVKYVL